MRYAINDTPHPKLQWIAHSLGSLYGGEKSLLLLKSGRIYYYPIQKRLSVLYKA